MGTLDGRVAVVTGAARGIGAALARRLAARGASVALLGLEPEQLAAVAADCGPAAGTWPVDVTDQAALDRVATDVRERYGRVDVVVANAGIAVGGPVLLSDPAAFDRVIEVNLLGSVRTARAFLPSLVDSRGYLLQIASLAAIAPAPLMSAYCASKSGVEAFAHSLRVEIAHHGVGVGVAYLSWTDTDMVRGADALGTLAEVRRRLAPPLNRTYPLGPAADRLAAGIERRAPHVYAPAWVRALQVVRAGIPGLLAVAGAREVPAAEAAIRAAGPAATQPVGPGGDADTRTRR